MIWFKSSLNACICLFIYHIETRCSMLAHGLFKWTKLNWTVRERRHFPALFREKGNYSKRRKTTHIFLRIQRRLRWWNSKREFPEHLLIGMECYIKLFKRHTLICAVYKNCLPLSSLHAIFALYVCVAFICYFFCNVCYKHRFTLLLLLRLVVRS